MTATITTFRFQLQSLESGRLLLQLAGELDIAVRPHLHELCAAVIATKPVSVELDLTGVTFIDLRGFRALLTIQQEFARHRIRATRGGSSAVVERLQNLLIAMEKNIEKNQFI